MYLQSEGMRHNKIPGLPWQRASYLGSMQVSNLFFLVFNTSADFFCLPSPAVFINFAQIVREIYVPFADTR